MEQKMINLKINGIAVTVPEGTTILDAARSVNIKIPTLCYLRDINGVLRLSRQRGDGGDDQQ